MSSAQRIIQNLPTGFDPDRHQAQLMKIISEKYGAGFEIDSIEPSLTQAGDPCWKVTATRYNSVSKVGDSKAGGLKEIGLPAKARATDGEMYSVRFAKQYPGYMMVEFNPHLKTALLAQLTEREVQCRRAVSTILGAKPWDIRVKEAPHGGYKVTLPKNYVPSKHYSKLQEVAEETVGAPGWIVEADAKSLECEFIPSAPPTFPEMLPFPLEQLGQGAVSQTAFGLKLPSTGQEQHEPAVINWDAQAFVLMGGMPGGGKRQPLDARIPVPVSHKFPTGWATMGELDLNDKVLGRDGSPQSVGWISPEVFGDVYKFELDDGQEVSSDPEHLWPVQRANVVDSCDKSHGLFMRSHQWATTSQVACAQQLEATVEAISQITKISKLKLQNFVDATKMPFRTTDQGECVYPVDEVIAWLADHDNCDHEPALLLMTTLQIAQSKNLSQYTLPMAGYSGALPELSDERMLEWERNFSRENLFFSPEILRAGTMSKNRIFIALRGLLNPQCSGEYEQWNIRGISAKDQELLVEFLRSMGMKVTRGESIFRVVVAPAGHVIKKVTKLAPALGKCIRVNDPSHIYLTEGFIPTHNTVTLNAIIADRVAKGSELVIVDIPDKSIDFMWCKEFVRDGGWGCESPEATVATLQMVYNEGSRRAKILKRGGFVNYLEMPEHERFSPITIIADEVAGLVVTDKIPAGVPKDNPLIQEKIQSNLIRIQTMSILEKIVAEMRFAGLHMVTASQVTNANTGLPPTMKSKMGHRLLQGGNPSKPARNQAFNDEASVPTVPTHIIEGGRVSKGVGLAELEGSGSFVYKSFYASPKDYQIALRRLGVPTTNRPAPTSHEIALYSPSLEESGGETEARREQMGDPVGGQTAYGDDGRPLRGVARASHASRVLAQQHQNNASNSNSH
ncbi:hypothetical protein [Glutamicibacter ardleyensis]|uniref:hypothetical protein n=1 Tax=Glutamicibacter ardleyensis TaxID=225894 RepID=UPI003FD6A31E